MTDFKRLLERGWQRWNEWRDKHPDVIPNLRNAMLPYGFDLSDYDLSYMNLSRMNFQDATLSRSRFPASHFYETNFQFANLSRAYLSKSAFHSADLSNANLCGAQLYSTHFFDDTKLIRTNFCEAKLVSANFAGARLGWTIFGANDLSTIRGLEDATIENQITIGIDTVFLSQGKIPITFLRAAQMPQDGMKFIESVASRPTHYQSCFVSYSSKNRDVADRLYKDLTNSGVYCWLATESLRGGEEFERKIGEAIASLDRFIVLISKEAARSDWVKKEVRIALNQKRKENFILPITLDNTYKYTRKRWINQLKTKHIMSMRTGDSRSYLGELLAALVKKQKS